MGPSFAHAQAGDHLAGDAGDALQVAGCTAADFVEDDFFGSPAAEGDADLSQVIRLRFIRPVFFGQHHGIAASRPRGMIVTLWTGSASGRR